MRTKKQTAFGSLGKLHRRKDGQSFNFESINEVEGGGGRSAHSFSRDLVARARI